MSYWQDRVAVVTGAGSGIGRATTEALLGAGARVALVGRRAEPLAEVAAPWGERARVLAVDVRDRPAVQAAIRTEIERLNRIDLLVHSAGICPIQLVEEIDDRIRETIETNTLGAVWATQAVLPAMRRARSGRIVYVASVDGHVAPAGYAGYAASKWALRALAESLRSELRGSGVRVSVVSPYYVRTPMLDREEQVGALPGYEPGAVLSPDAVARAILRAAETGSREVILAPRALRLGLFLGKLLPGIQDLVLARQARGLVRSRSAGPSKTF